MRARYAHVANQSTLYKSTLSNVHLIEHPVHPVHLYEVVQNVRVVHNYFTLPPLKLKPANPILLELGHSWRGILGMY